MFLLFCPQFRNPLLLTAFLVPNLGLWDGSVKGSKPKDITLFPAATIFCRVVVTFSEGRHGPNTVRLHALWVSTCCTQYRRCCGCVTCWRFFWGFLGWCQVRRSWPRLKRRLHELGTAFISGGVKKRRKRCLMWNNDLQGICCYKNPSRVRINEISLNDWCFSHQEPKEAVSFIDMAGASRSCFESGSFTSGFHMGVAPSHGWPWLRIETYDVGIPHDLRNPLKFHCESWNYFPPGNHWADCAQLFFQFRQVPKVHMDDLRWATLPCDPEQLMHGKLGWTTLPSARQCCEFLYHDLQILKTLGFCCNSFQEREETFSQ